jgi:hypothetical protein
MLVISLEFCYFKASKMPMERDIGKFSVPLELPTGRGPTTYKATTYKRERFRVKHEYLIPSFHAYP